MSANNAALEASLVSQEKNAVAELSEIRAQLAAVRYRGYEREAQLCRKETVVGVSVLPDGRFASCSNLFVTSPFVADAWVIRVFDRRAGCVQTLTVPQGTARCMTILADGRIVLGCSNASGSVRDVLQVRDLNDTTYCLTLAGHEHAIDCVAAVPDGSVVSASRDASLRQWDLKDGRCINTLAGHTGAVRAVAPLPTGHRVVSASWDKSLKVWDLELGHCLQTLSGHSYGVNCVAAMPDGRVVSGASDHKIKLWDPDTGRCLQTLEGHEDCVNCVAHLPDGRIASGSMDEALYIWDAAGRRVQMMYGHAIGVSGVVALPAPDVRIVSWSNYSEPGELPTDDDFFLKVWVDRRRQAEQLAAKAVARQRGCCDVAGVIGKFL